MDGPVAGDSPHCREDRLCQDLAAKHPAVRLRLLKKNAQGAYAATGVTRIIAPAALALVR